MNIAICDDEILFTRELSSLLTHWAEKNDFSLTLYPYSNGDDLLTALRTIPVDLIFLDIIMPCIKRHRYSKRNTQHGTDCSCDFSDFFQRICPGFLWCKSFSLSFKTSKYSETFFCYGWFFLNLSCSGWNFRRTYCRRILLNYAQWCRLSGSSE